MKAAYQPLKLIVLTDIQNILTFNDIKECSEEDPQISITTKDVQIGTDKTLATVSFYVTISDN